MPSRAGYYKEGIDYGAVPSLSIPFVGFTYASSNAGILYRTV